MNTFQLIVVPLAFAFAMGELIGWIRGGRRIGLIKSFVWLAFAVAVFQPDLVQQLAGYAKIGRGADLLLYGLAVFVLLSTFHFQDQLETQRKQLTILVRELAISRPQWPETSQKPASDESTTT